MKGRIKKASIDYDRGAVDGNSDLPPVEPENPDYMRGYGEGLRLADLGVPYSVSYPQRTRKKRR